MAIITQSDPIQMQASDTENATRTEVYGNTGNKHIPTVTHVTTLKKLTPNGSAGSITFTNGSITAYTRPT